MQIDILADIPDPSKRALEFHQRLQVGSHQVEFDEIRKTLIIKADIDENDVIEFGGVTLLTIGSSGISLRGITRTASGTLTAPQSRLIYITFQ
jgi:hypothetical protein